MPAILHLLVMFPAGLFKSRRRLVAENLFLRHQLDIALSRASPRLRLYGSDRALLVWMTRIWPSLLEISQVTKPETVLRWYRSGFTAFWRWKSRNRAGRPKVAGELRDLIRRMSRDNPLWGAPRDPWRTADAGVRGRPVDGLQIHDAGSVKNCDAISPVNKLSSSDIYLTP
jgi:hypothetical protein